MSQPAAEALVVPLAGEARPGTSWGRATVVEQGVVEVAGGDTYADETYVAVVGDDVVVGERIEHVLDRMRAAGLALEVDPLTISSQLNHILWVTPTTPFRGVTRLLPGHRMTIRSDRPSEVSGNYPFMAARSRHDQEPSTRRLLDLIVEATELELATRPSAMLMLSAGKDSTALALALAEAGRHDVACVTIVTGDDDPELARAAATCRRFGLEHVVVTMPAPAEAESALRTFFAATPVPTTDLALVPYALAMHRLATPGAAVLDGTGNDLYFGHVETRDERIKRLLRVRGRRLATALTRVLPVDSPTNYLLRSRLATSFPVRTMRHAELSRIYPDAVDTHRLLFELTREHRDMTHEDLTAAFMQRYEPLGGPLLKLRLAARGNGMEPALPYCDRRLAEYCFHLPERAKQAGVGKILLREMLLEHADYDAAAVGKLPFVFDAARFLTENRRFVLDEISGCALWSRQAASLAGRWLDALPRRPFLSHALIGWFQMSAWHNHSTYAPRTAP